MLTTLFLCMAIAQQPPPPPPDIAVNVKHTGKVGRYMALLAETKGQLVLWRAIDPGIDFLDAVLSPTDTRITGVIADTPGTYRLMAITSVNNKPAVAEFSVTFEGKRPPGPPPVPPAPPTPGDPLVAKLQAAYEKDAAAASVKDGHRRLLVGFYDAMSEHAKSAAIKTTGELLADMRLVSSQMIAPNALIECRKVVAGEIATAIGNDPAVSLDPNLRGPAVAVFDRLAKAMAQVK